MGLGFGHHMTDADAIVCVVSDHPSAADWTLLGRDTSDTHPDSDLRQTNGAPGKDDLLSWVTAVQDGIQCRFRRYLDTGDSLDTVITNELTPCIWAYHDSPTWEQHDFRNRARVKINFFTGDIVKEVNYWPIHGILMFLSWGAFIPLASLLARNFKWIGHSWFEIHRLLQTIAIMMMISAFALAVVMVNRDSEAHFHGKHQIIGLVLFLIGCLQPFIGQLANFMFDPNRQKTPIFPDRIHGILGWGGIFLAVANIFLGIKLYGSSSVVWILYIIWVVVLFVIGLAIQVMDKMKVFSSKTS